MKIMTFNTQHCLNFKTNKIDFEIMAEVIKKLNPDICGLNEMFDESKDEDFNLQTDKLAKLSGFKESIFAKAIELEKGSYGNGFLSKIPVISKEIIKIPDPVCKKYSGYYETRCLLKVKLEGNITVLATHFGLNPDELFNAVETVIANLEKEKCILMGDFNLESQDEMLNPIREKMVDTADLFESEKLSWPSDKPKMKIDYIFVSPDIKVKSADIPEIIASDHRPYIAEIEI